MFAMTCMTMSCSLAAPLRSEAWAPADLSGLAHAIKNNLFVVCCVDVPLTILRYSPQPDLRSHMETMDLRTQGNPMSEMAMSYAQNCLFASPEAELHCPRWQGYLWLP